MSQNGQPKIAFVTGASRGIGRAIALKLASENACTVIGTATSRAGADRISKFFSDAGLNGYGVVLDVHETGQIQKTLAEIIDRHQSIDILINNAGITRDNLLMRMKENEWYDVIKVNLDAAYFTSKACLRTMMKARWGRIIQIGSVIGSIGNAGQSNYAAAKAGLIGLTKSLACEVAPRNITVNLVAPGFIETDMVAALSDKQRQQLVEHIPNKKIGKPEDIAHMVCFLASYRADYVTGQVIHVNGGMY